MVSHFWILLDISWPNLENVIFLKMWTNVCFQVNFHGWTPTLNPIILILWIQLISLILKKWSIMQHSSTTTLNTLIMIIRLIPTHTHPDTQYHVSRIEGHRIRCSLLWLLLGPSRNVWCCWTRIIIYDSLFNCVRIVWAIVQHAC